MTYAQLTKAFDKLNAEIAAFAKESDQENEVDLYEDAWTIRSVKPNFKLCKNLNLHWTEDGQKEILEHYSEDDANESLKFWRANLRRAKKYWAMSCEELDAIQNEEAEDIEVEEED